MIMLSWSYVVNEDRFRSITKKVIQKQELIFWIDLLSDEANGEDLAAKKPNMIFHKTNLPSSKAGRRHWNYENLALKNHSSFDSLRYDCVLFVSLIKLKGESIAAKNVLFMSLV